MPQVPYKPVPGVRDLGRPIYPGTGGGPIHVTTPELGPDVFGANVGRAMEHFGTVSEQTGQELFARAEAFKKLDNSNDATNAAIDADKDQTVLMEELKKKEGKDAVDAYEGFDDKLEQIRQAHRAKLKSPDAQREYDQMTRTTQNRMFASGASYAGTQHKAWTDATNKAKTAQSINNVSFMPHEVQNIDKMLADVEADTRQTYSGVDGQGKGWPQEEVDLAVRRNKSTAIGKALGNLGDVDPTTASLYLKKYWDQMEPEDRDFADKKIQNGANHALPRGVMADITTGRDMSILDKKVPIERMRDAMGFRESSNNYLSHPEVQTAHGRPLGRYQVMEGFLQDYLKRAGMKSMTPEEFLHDPGAQDLLFTRVFQKLMDDTGSAKEAASAWFTGGSYARARASGVKDAFGTKIDSYLAPVAARLAKTAGPEELSALAQKKGQELDPNGEYPLLPHFLDEAAKSQSAINNQLKKEINFDNWSTALRAVATPDKDGKYMQTWDDLWRDPAVKRAWDGLSEGQQQNLRTRLQENIKKGYELTPEKEERYKVLDGMLNTAAGKAKFMDEVDLTAEHLPNNMTLRLMDKAKEARGKWGQDEPSTRHINEAYGPLMNSAGIKKNTDEYWSFISAVQGAWDAHQEQYGKPMSPQEKQAVGAQILQEKAGWFKQHTFGLLGSSERMYQHIPDEYREQITKELTAQYGAEPNQHQIERAYFTQLYNAMFQQSRGKGDRAVQRTSPEPKPEAVPVSK